MKQTLVVMLLMGAILLLTGVAGMVIGPGLNQPSPIGPYLDGAFPNKLSTTWEWVNQYTGTGMSNVITVRRIPGTNRYAFGTINGKVYSFDFDQPDPVPVLIGDIEPPGGFLNNRYGLKGVAFHPDFGQAGSPNRGYLYVAYMTTETKRRLSRFHFPDGATAFDPATELVMIEQLVPGGSYHSIGEISFGPDGFLYVPFGDGHGGGFGPFAGTDIADTIMNVVQRVDHNLSGGILRLDVDQDPAKSHAPRRVLPQAFPEEISGIGYWIPNDNPWQAADSSIMEEYFSLGHRNPWKLTIDPQTGIPWVGEVGPHNGEEVNRVAKGHNYGWPYRVGPTGEIDWDRTPPSAPEPAPYLGVLTEPVFSSARADGRSMMVGCVYRGELFPELQGKLIAGDVATRNMWLVHYDEFSQTGTLETLPLQPGKGYVVFEDPNGEVLLVRTNGTIMKLRRASAGAADPPATLSATGAFADLLSLTPAPGLIPYRVNSPLWSDGAIKYRWIALPNDGIHDSAAEQISFDPKGPWGFPAGTVLIKHFELPTDPLVPTATTRLETRFIVIGENQDYYGVTYRWNEAGTEAMLLEGRESRDVVVQDLSGNAVMQPWDFPGRTDCLSCHTRNAGRVLGVNTHQLNGDLFYPATSMTANQLETWNYLNMFDRDLGLPDQYLKAAPIGDPVATPEHQVLSYLDANCAHCHRPGGVTGAFDARLAMDLENHRLLAEINQSPNSVPGGIIVDPGSPATSELFVRDNMLGTAAMPPLAKNLVDEPYLEVLEGWIAGLAPDVQSFDQIGEVGQAEAEEHWVAVTLQNAYDDPVVIAGGLSYVGEQAAFVRIRNVSATGFEVKVEEWSCMDQNHSVETIDYLVVEAGDYQLPDGRRLLAGNLAAVTHAWQDHSYSRAFAAEPVLLAHCASYQETGGIVRIRHQETDETGFRLRIQEDEGADGSHQPETVSWIAIEPGIAESGLASEAGQYVGVDENWERIPFRQNYAYRPLFIGQFISHFGGDPGVLRYRRTTLTGYGVEVVFQEESCSDSELAHFDEDINFLVFERPGILLGHDLSQTKLRIKIALQGPWAGEAMATGLEALLPPNDPLGLNQVVEQFPAGVVDWVQVDIRNPADSTEVLASRACFVRKDGQLVEADGTIGVRFNDLNLSSAYVVVRHRNHLGVMTAGKVDLSLPE